MVAHDKRSARRTAGHLRVVEGGGAAPASEAAPQASVESRRRRDDELLDAFEHGSREAATQLYDHLAPVVHRTLMQVLGRRCDDHEDLVQAAFEQIVITLVRKRFARACSLKSWAASISANVAFNAIRSRTRERRVVDTTHELDTERHDDRRGVDAERHAVARAELERVRRVLAQIDSKKATALFLHDVLGHDLAEISVLTGVTVAAAQSRLVRGRRELQRKLGGRGGVDIPPEGGRRG